MIFLGLALCAFVLVVFCCLRVGSDADDEMGYDDYPDTED